MTSDMADAIELMALAILNSDRASHGWPPVASRENIPDSDGYVRNARDVIAALVDAGLAVVPVIPSQEMIYQAKEAKHRCSPSPSMFWAVMVEAGRMKR